jgi:hypothetical protein
MKNLELQCKLEKCAIDYLTQMELKKCLTQNDNEHPDRFQPCPYLIISSADSFHKGEVWKKFGDIIDKAKVNEKKRLE